MLRKVAAFILSMSMIFGSFSSNSVFAENSNTENNTSDVSNTSKMVAFPGAEGGGMYATGARGASENAEQMSVYHVTNLDNSGEGSFRDAVSKGNRIVVFDVSGMIDLESNVNIGCKNITILGQTAPGDGICFRGNNIKVSGENIILRYLRFRVGDKLANGSDTRTQDGLEVTDNTTNVIIDHCSVSWGTDENLTAYAVKDITIQNCIIAESLNQSIHDKGEHSYAAIWGGVNLTVHHNIIANHKSRNPKIGTSETTAMTAGYKDSDTVVDIRNNIIYNWGDKAGYGAENGAQVNIINNWYKPGPATPENKRARIFEYSVGNKYQKNWSGKVYADGNFIDVDENDTELAKQNAAAVNENNFQPDNAGTVGKGVYPDPSVPDMIYENLSAPNTTYINDYPIKTTSAEDAYNYVINNAGARLPKLDLVDQRIIDNVVNRTAPNGSEGSSGLVDSPADGVPEADKDKYDDRGYPIIDNVVRESSFDSDGDGIADSWEDKMGLDKTNPNDSLNIAPDGYTWLEIYVEDAIVNADKEKNSAAISSITPVDEQNGIFNVEYACQGENVSKVDFYSNGEVVGSSETVGTNKEITLSPGENYVTIKITNSSGVISYSNTVVVYAKGKAFADSDFNVSTDANTSVSKTDEKYYLYSKNGAEGFIGKDDLQEDFNFVADIDKISNLNNGVQTGVCIKNESGKFIKVYKTYENNKLVIKVDENGTTSDVSDVNAFSADMLKVSKSGDNIVIQAGASAASLSNVLEKSYATDFEGSKLSVNAYVLTPENVETISDFDNIKFINSDEITTPVVEINNVSNNQRLGFKETLELTVTPDSKAKITEVAVFFNDNPVNSVAFENGIAEKQTVSVPISFTSVSHGVLRVVCFDQNLGMGEATVEVSISGDITPWKVTNIGGTDTDMASYVQSTADYTYKFNGVDGNIGGTSDKYGYMYQKFNDDMRLYYRGRPTGNKNFGIMLKDDLDADGVSYYFGTEAAATGYTYVLKARKTKGAEYETIKSFPEMTVDKYFIIAEKEGNKFKIYTNPGTNDDLYKSKTLIAETEIPFGDSYYMGYTAANISDGVPDAGWLDIESIDKGISQSYKWNLDYGPDWSWYHQVQNRTTLAPTWTSEDIGGNATGKMVIAPDDDYISSFIMREVIVDEGVVNNGFDVFLTGEKPGIEFFLQTATGVAYKVSFNTDGTISLGDNVVDGAAYKNSEWYKAFISTEVGEKVDNTADITICDSAGNVVAQSENVPASSFASVNKPQTKVAIKQGLFIRPIEGAKGVYYTDNMYISLNTKSSLENAISSAKALKESEYSAKTWLVLAEALSNAEKVYNDANADTETILNAAKALQDALSGLEPMQGVIKGEEKLWNFSVAPFDDYVKAGSMPANTVIDDILTFTTTSDIDGSSKKFDGISFSKRIKVGTNHIKLAVPGKCDIVVYALSAKSSETRNLVITAGDKTEKYALTGTPVSASFSYEGTTPTVIDIYGESGLNYYGIKYTPYVIIDKTTKITSYDKTTGEAQFYNGMANLENAVMAVIVTDNNGKLLEVKHKEFNVTAGLEETQNVDVGTVSASGNVKVVLWDNLDSMKPLCNSFEVK